MKTTLITLISTILAFAGSAQAQFSNTSGGIMLGGGYLEGTETAYGFAQIRGTFYEDDTFAHTAFLEILGHSDSVTLDFVGPGGTFSEDGDITFVNITANYELEAKLFGPISAYAGGGIGVEIVSVDDRFDFELDSDANFTSQLFMGLRADFGNGFQIQAGARYLIWQDSEVLNVAYEASESWAFEIGAGFQF